MKRKMLGAVCLMVVCGAAKLSAQAHADRPNRALEQLRSGVWLERGGFDSFEPEGAAPAGPVGAAAAPGEFRLVAAGWDMPQLTPPTLHTGVRLDPPNRVPVPVEVKPIEAARPAESARAIAVIPESGLSPCQDLRRKASSLRNAASQCDTDIANGHPYCNVAVSFDSPRIPRSLTSQAARGYAGQFESVSGDGSEQACAEYGGEGSMPLAINRPLEYENERRALSFSQTGNRKRCMDDYLRNNYNNFVADTLVPYFSAGSVGTREYWESVLESTVVKGSILGALGVGRSYYSTKEYEALGRSLNEWGWLGVMGRRNAIVGAATRAANIATAQAFLEGAVGVVVAGGGAFATTAHGMAYSACASEAP